MIESQCFNDTDVQCTRTDIYFHLDDRNSPNEIIPKAPAALQRTFFRSKFDVEEGSLLSTFKSMPSLFGKGSI